MQSRFRFRSSGDGLEIVQPLGEGWTALYRVMAPGPRIASISVVPDADAARPSVLRRRDPIGELPPMPTARVLREIRPRAALQALAREMTPPNSLLRPMARLAGNLYGEEWGPVFDQLDSAETPPLEARLYLLASIAYLYVEACGRGDRSPVRTVAAARGQEPKLIRDQLHSAREALLLTWDKQGRAGGQITDRARQLLERRQSHD